MAGTKAGGIFIDVKADIEGLRKDLKKAEKKLKETSKKMEEGLKGFDDKLQGTGKQTETLGNRMRKSFSGVTATIKKMKGGLAAVAAVIASLGVAKLASLSKQAIRSAKDLSDVSAKLGVGAGALQEFQFAAGQSGVKVETLNMGLQRFGRRAAEAANGTGEALAAIKTLGIQLRDSNGQLRSTEDLFVDAMNALGGIDNQLDKVRLGFKLFDSEGVALVNMAGNLEELREEARSLGLILGDDLIARSDELQDTFDALSTVVNVQLAPALIDFGSSVLEPLAETTAEAATVFNQFYRSVRDVEDLDFENLKLLSSEMEQQIELARLAEQIQGKSLWQMLGISDDSDDLVARRKAVDARIAELEKQKRELQSKGINPSSGGNLSGTGENQKVQSLIDKLQARRTKAQGDELAHMDLVHSQELRLIGESLENNSNRYEILRELQEVQAVERLELEQKIAKEESKLQTAALEQAEKVAEKKSEYLQDLTIKSLESTGKQIEAEKLRLLQQIETLNEMGLNEAEYQQAVQDLAEITTSKLEKINEERKGQWGELFDFMESGFSDALATMLIDGEFTFDSLAKSFAREFIQKGIEETIFPAIHNLFKGLGGGGGIGGFFGSIGNLFGGGGGVGGGGGMFANGGHISSGPVLVGERGPELFTPSNSGYVTSNLALQRMGRGGGSNVNVTVINNSGEKATTTERDGANGMKEIEVMIGKSVSKSIARGGEVDKAIRNSYGIQRVGRHGL